jgi:hypothetical protein
VRRRLTPARVGAFDPRQRVTPRERLEGVRSTSVSALTRHERAEFVRSTVDSF